MRRPSRASLALLPTAVVLMAGAGVAAADDWPQYQADATHAGIAGGPEPPYGVAWTAAVPPGGPQERFGLSAPIVVGDLVVAVGPVSVEAFDVGTGEPAWSIERELGPSVPAATSADGALLLFTEGWGAGPEPLTGGAPPSVAETAAPTTGAPASSPSPDAAQDGFAGPSRMVAVALPGGERAWEVDLPQVSRTGVTVMGDLALVGTNDGTVTAADVASGEVRWSADAGRNVEHPIAVAGDVAVVSVGGGDTTPASLVGLALDDGAEAWRFEPEVPSVILGPPTVGDSVGGGMAFVGVADGTVQAIATADGAPKWSARINQWSLWAPSALEEDRLFTANASGQLYALDAETGERIWDHPRNVAVIRPAPVVAGSAVLMGTGEGQVVAFDTESGDAVWHLDLGTGPIQGMAATGEELIVVRGGPDAGLVALVPDQAASSVREQSPTVVEPVRLIGNWAIAAAVLGAVTLLVGFTLARRMGPADLGGPEELEPEPGEES